jgi:acyl carrier protein
MVDFQTFLTRFTRTLRDDFGISDTITATTTLEDLYLDSLDQVDLIMRLEDEFGLQEYALDEEKLTLDSTMQDLYELVSASMAKATNAVIAA